MALSPMRARIFSGAMASAHLPSGPTTTSFSESPGTSSRSAQWNDEITQQGGRPQDGSRLWFRGKALPDGSPESFDKDCSAILRDLADRFPRNAEDEGFTYAEADIDELSQRLRICWELSKSVPFRPEVPYLGFLWDLEARTVRLLEKKRLKYAAAITEWEEKRTHNLFKT